MSYDRPWHKQDNYPAHQAWQILRRTKKQTLRATSNSKGIPLNVYDRPLSQVPRKQEDTVRFVCVSDTHSKHKDLRLPKDGDVLIHAGDFSETGRMNEVHAFTQWLSTVPYKHKVVIAGNHDTLLDPPSYEKNWQRFHHEQQWSHEEARAELEAVCTYLENSSSIVEGYTFYGSPWQPQFCDWAFNAKRGAECRALWEQIPPTTDILVTHGPPVGYRDQTMMGEHVGCVDLLEATQRVQPIVHVFGHIHDAHGVLSDGATTYINASSCTERYQADNPCVIFDLPKRDQ